MLLPDEIIKQIFEYTGEYKYRNGEIIKIIPKCDTRYELLRSIPVKCEFASCRNIIEVLFPINRDYKDISYKLLFTEIIINNVRANKFFFYKLDDRGMKSAVYSYNMI